MAGYDAQCQHESRPQAQDLDKIENEAIPVVHALTFIGWEGLPGNILTADTEQCQAQAHQGYKEERLVHDFMKKAQGMNKPNGMDTPRVRVKSKATVV